MKDLFIAGGKLPNCKLKKMILGGNSSVADMLSQLHLERGTKGHEDAFINVFCVLEEMLYVPQT